MDNNTNTQLVLSGLVMSEMLGIEVPEAIKTPTGVTYFWNEGAGCFLSATGAELYIEPSDEDGIITADSYYEED